MLFYKDFCILMSRGCDLPEDFNFDKEYITLSDAGLELSGNGVFVNHKNVGFFFEAMSTEEKLAQYKKYIAYSFALALETGSLCIDDTFFSAKDSFLGGKAVFRHSEHKKMWNWLAKNPDYTKDDYFFKNKIPHPYPKHLCFACEADSAGLKLFADATNCTHCPLEWVKGEDFTCENEKSPYKKWYNEKSGTKARAKLARQVANLPINPKFKGIVILD